MKIMIDITELFIQYKSNAINYDELIRLIDEKLLKNDIMDPLELELSMSTALDEWQRNALLMKFVRIPIDDNVILKTLKRLICDVSKPELYMHFIKNAYEEWGCGIKYEELYWSLMQLVLYDDIEEVEIKKIISAWGIEHKLSIII